MARKYSVIAESRGKTVAFGSSSKNEAKSTLQWLKTSSKFRSAFKVKNPRIRRIK
jgi:hypothetical protein